MSLLKDFGEINTISDLEGAFEKAVEADCGSARYCAFFSALDKSQKILQNADYDERRTILRSGFKAASKLLLPQNVKAAWYVMGSTDGWDDVLPVLLSDSIDRLRLACDEESGIYRANSIMAAISERPYAFNDLNEEQSAELLETIQVAIEGLSHTYKAAVRNTMMITPGWEKVIEVMDRPAESLKETPVEASKEKPDDLDLGFANAVPA